VNGDGETSRDFCFVENAVRANILAALSNQPEACGKNYNVACGERATLNELFAALKALAAKHNPKAAEAKAVYRAERQGDVRHSLADISLARRLLGYEPAVMVREGLEKASGWYAGLAGRKG